MDQNNKITNTIKLLSTYSILGTVIYEVLSSLRRYDNVDDFDKIKLIFSRIENIARENMGANYDK